MKKINRKSLAEFENTHGAPKIHALEKRLAAEHAKVEALADVQNKIVVETSESCRLRFAVTADLHIGSLYAHTDALAAFYEYALSSGVDKVLCAGDVLDGHRVYRGQEFELRDVGLDAQLDRLRSVVRGLPFIETSFITGNHDQSFKVAAGAPTGRMIADATGWQFLGEEQGRVRYNTPKGDFDVLLVHPGGGASYALSYKIQKQMESIEGGGKPSVLIDGHYHKALFMPNYRNVAALLGGTFQRQTPFMARGGLAAHVGGWIVDATVGVGCNVISAQFVAFYK